MCIFVYHHLKTLPCKPNMSEYRCLFFLLKKSVSKWNDLVFDWLVRFRSNATGPQNCITKLFTINWKWLNRKKSLKSYLTGKSEWDGFLSIRNPLVSANSKTSCRQQNVFSGHQATQYFLDLAETVFKSLKAVLATTEQNKLNC